MRYGYEGANHVSARQGGKVNETWMPKDDSNPYFTYDPSKCIVCNRCVRACEGVQGTFALTIAGRGFDSRVSPGMSESFRESECVSCGACVLHRHAHREGRDRRATEFRRIQHQYGRDAVGGITSSRCTNEETFLVQKLIRAGFGVHNVDTCARVCHSPTDYGLKTAFGTSAGTQDFDSVEHGDVILVIGANPTDGHPVFASRMKKRLRHGARLIVVDPRRIDLVRSPHVEAHHHLPLLPGTNVAVPTAMAHVIVTEGLVNEAFVRERCEPDEFREWAAFAAEERHSPEAVAKPPSWRRTAPSPMRSAASSPCAAP